MPPKRPTKVVKDRTLSEVTADVQKMCTDKVGINFERLEDGIVFYWRHGTTYMSGFDTAAEAAEDFLHHFNALTL